MNIFTVKFMFDVHWSMSPKKIKYIDDLTVSQFIVCPQMECFWTIKFKICRNYIWKMKWS